MSLLQKDRWHLWSNNVKNVAEIFELISKAPYCKVLFLHLFKKVQLPPIIQNTQFPNLTHLCLAKNKINNIESLSFIKCPNIEHLSLEQNQITKINPLVKTNFKNLKYLSIHKNKFGRIEGGRFYSNKENSLRIKIINYRFIDQFVQPGEKMIEDIVSVYMKLENSFVHESLISQLYEYHSNQIFKTYNFSSTFSHIAQLRVCYKIFERFRFTQERQVMMRAYRWLAEYSHTQS